MQSHAIMDYVYSWPPIIEYVLQLPSEQHVWVPKENVPYPQAVGILFNYGAYRQTMPDGRAIDIKEDGDYWRIHWDKYNPNTHLIEHCVCDAPVQWLLVMASIGAAFSPKGKKGEGALKGLGWGFALGLLLKAILSRNEGDYISKWH